MTDKVPVLDLEESREVQLKTLDCALRNYGFFYLANHGIDLESQFDAARNFFDLPPDEKTAMPFDCQLDSGYVGTGGQNLDYSVTAGTSNSSGANVENEVPGDTKEQFMQTNNILLTEGSFKADVDPSNIFLGSKNYTVSALPGYNDTTLQYANALYEVNMKLNNLLFECLGISEEDKRCLGTKPFVVLKQMKYHGEISDPTAGKFGRWLYLLHQSQAASCRLSNVDIRLL